VLLKLSITGTLSTFFMRKSSVANSVGDQDPVGSGPFCRIRIQKF
jgi:hypothetical protein